MSRITEHYQRARKSLAGGVSASTRVNRALGHPMYFSRAAGCQVWDFDGRDYYDLCCSHGATLLGHGDERITRAVHEAIAAGAACSYENETHAELAELLCDSIPAFERVRFTGSGTEATMHTIRLARAFTGRTKLLKIEGHFHGYHDQVMFAIGSPPSPLTAESAPGTWPASSGMPAELVEQLVVVPFNRTDLLAEALAKYGDELAAVICEPVFYNAGCILPSREFIRVMREETRRRGVLLIFDEVQSAFRMGPGGAQAHLGITPDLCTVGKAVGGTYPLSVFGGRADIMARLQPEGDCQHSGTYNGHPVVVAAALAALKAYLEPGFYEHVFAIADRLYTGINDVFDRYELPGRAIGLGARFGIYFGIDDQPQDFRDTLQHSRTLMLQFIRAAIEHGVYLHDYGGGACHHGFCAAMTTADVDQTLDRLAAAVQSMQPTGQRTLAAH
ncbi:Glutamate-1-semialdehyde 2,1-aminomutase 1 [Anatilimnocola aggregata]|uniref:Glutamate-1-semialdehyde 2,1-aminomutase 1 n=1 Tax=Anatilimnocola aggregata TaxID=2528021 RepID=A0A517YHR0_9BACT|nr:aminotransferase class III-fold pyridoxal phosphate-dependent enzyme [Anatilimnocola aggregata]QDU29756.1 Glutamate-1-semialdehyde 2,1-aminomutase 1 [Anatilimnocola aggregata]